MTKPTPEQIQRACDMAINDGAARGQRSYYTPDSYGISNCFTALADTIAELDEMRASRDAANVRASEVMDRLDKAEADLREIDRIAKHWNWGCFGADSTGRQDISLIAAPYRVETDPLVVQFPALLNLLRYHETGGHEGDGTDRAMEAARSELLELAKRGIEV